ncbi:MAG: cupin domain-containing protein [Nocardioidaceae bacterium]
MDALDLLSGDAPAFLRTAWASHAHIHKADPGDVVDLLSIDDVDQLLTSTALRTPALRVARDGSVLPSSAYTRSATIAGVPLTGLIDARKVVELFDDGATLVLQGLHRYWPPLAELIRGLEASLGHPCQANAYLTPPGSQGFALHSDSHDVFVFQTHGSKQWEIHDNGQQLDVLMEPGTSMYLPTGTPTPLAPSRPPPCTSRSASTSPPGDTCSSGHSPTYSMTRRSTTDCPSATPTTRRSWPASSLIGSGCLQTRSRRWTSELAPRRRRAVSSPVAHPFCAAPSPTGSYSRRSTTTPRSFDDPARSAS